MGIELPEGVLKQLQLQEQSGLLDWRACVQALDGYVFKHRSLVDEVPQEVIDSAQAKLINVLNSSVSSFQFFLTLFEFIFCYLLRDLLIHFQNYYNYLVKLMKMVINDYHIMNFEKHVVILLI